MVFERNKWIAEVESQNSQIKTLKETLDFAISEKNNLKIESENKNFEIKSLKNSSDSITFEIENLRNINNNITQSLERSKNAEIKLLEELSSLKSYINSQDSQNNLITSRLLKIQSLYQELESDFRQATKNLSEKESIISQFSDKIKKILQKLDKKNLKIRNFKQDKQTSGRGNTILTSTRDNTYDLEAT